MSRRPGKYRIRQKWVCRPRAVHKPNSALGVTAIDHGPESSVSCEYPGRMNGVLLVLIIVVVAAIGLAVWSASRNSASRNAASLADAKADARRVIDRLGGQVLNLSGTDDASKQALADASERFNAAGAQIEQATTAKQALL